jgi:archaellin
MLSPVVGRIGFTDCCDENCPDEKTISGLWEFCQHKSGKEFICYKEEGEKNTAVTYKLGHVENGGVGYASDTYAWDVNLRTSTNSDEDNGKPVYTIAPGKVADHFGQILSCPQITAENGIRTCENEKEMPFTDALNAGGNMGQVLIDHGGWYSGYVHLSDIHVKVGDDVTEDTILGSISSTGTDNNHLHFAVYTGENTACGLKSVDVRIRERDIETQTHKMSGDIQLQGNTFGFSETSRPTNLDYIQFSLGASPGGNPVDLSTIAISYSDGTTDWPAFTYVPGTSVAGSSVARSARWGITRISGSTSGSTILSQGTEFMIVAGLPPSTTPNSKFVITLRMPGGSEIRISRTVPAALQRVNVLY